jgi:hypothetical protein
MDEEYAEQSDLERRISEAGWHILREEHLADGYVVEYQLGPPTGFHLRSETRTSKGKDRNDAYRRFLEELGVLHSGVAR